MSCAGCNRVETHPMTLADDRIVCNQCPDWRAECEARWIISMPSKEARANQIAGVRQKRGDAAADELAGKVRALWHAR